jgi:hypothetical protein
MISRETAFEHRENCDGTIDSICRKCFATVGRSVREMELEQAERDHICDPDLLERWNRLAAQKSIDGPQQP